MSNTTTYERSASRGSATVAAMLMVMVPLLMGVSSTALAVDASGPGVTAVKDSYAALPADLKQHYFAQKSNPKPQWTPGGGVFQYFSGDWGAGAIYWSPDRIDPDFDNKAYRIYGEILPYWSGLGFENGAGYPYTNEYTPRGEWECPGALRMQRFDHDWNICWNWDAIWLEHCGC